MLLLGGAGGCYSRVVDAHGLGTSGVQTQQKTETGLFDWLMGPEPESDEGRPQMRVN